MFIIWSDELNTSTNLVSLVPFHMKLVFTWTAKMCNLILQEQPIPITQRGKFNFMWTFSATLSAEIVLMGQEILERLAGKAFNSWYWRLS